MDERLEKYVADLSRLIDVPTVSDAAVRDEEVFARFRALLPEIFPRVFASFRCELFHGSILLSHIVEGGAEPVLFMSHHDVVPENGQWDKQAFRASVEDGRIYGRGTLDTKGNLWAILEAVEELLGEGFVFPRSVYVESACNEETTGAGALEISRELKKRGVRFAFTLDEGGMIVHDPIGGADGYFAMVAVGEKDCIDLKFTARSDGGHSSTPDKTNPLSRLARFVVDVEKRSLFRPRLNDTTVGTFVKLSEKMTGVRGFIFRHAGAFRYLLAHLMPGISPTANSMVRTTLCFTRARGSDAFNVIPTEACVTGNMRLSHHDRKEDVLKKLGSIARKYDVEIEELDPGYHSGVCCHDTPAFGFLERMVTETFPGVITVPYISTGASDSKYFTDLSDNVFRFAPFTVTDAQLDAMHARDENIDVSTLTPAVDFYKNLIRSM